MMVGMKKRVASLVSLGFFLGLFLVPALTFAATSVQSLLTDIVLFVNRTIIPVLFSLAFLFFLWNVFRYFILGGDQEESRKKARLFAVWGIIAFVVMVSVWGIVNLLASSLGISRGLPLCPDFFPNHLCRSTGTDVGLPPSGAFSPDVFTQ